MLMRATMKLSLRSILETMSCSVSLSLIATRKTLLSWSWMSLWTISFHVMDRNSVEPIPSFSLPTESGVKRNIKEEKPIKYFHLKGVRNNLKGIHAAENPVGGEEERIGHDDEARERRKPKSIGDDVCAQMVTGALVMALEDAVPVEEPK
jgi:hypothetical protein